MGGFKGISAISVSHIAVLGSIAITFAEFTRLVMCESLTVIRCRFSLSSALECRFASLIGQFSLC